MEFELIADPDAVGNLARLKLLSGNRVGRPRTQLVKIVWHDCPEHALMGQGLALSEQRGAFRLERLTPGPHVWLPAQPAPVVDEAPDLTSLPGPLAPLAAFEGRRTTSVHQIAAQSITLTVAKGTLRAVASEQSVARIAISGEEAAVRAAALAIAAAIDVAVPAASLAAQGLALATIGPAMPRREGAPFLHDATVSVADALAQIIGHLTDVILAQAPLAAGPIDTGAEAVHQMRVAVRRARSALGVFRPAVEPAALAAINTRLRTLGAQLAPSRDWDVFVDETLPAVRKAIPGDSGLERLAASAARRRLTRRGELAAYLTGPAFRLLGIELSLFAAGQAWHQPPAPDAAVLTAFSAVVLRHRARHLVSIGKRLDDLDIAGLHGVRLRAKRTRYAAEMFAALYPGKGSSRFIRRLGVLQQRLGVLNDGAAASHLLSELGGPTGRHAYAAGVVAGYLAARAEKIRPGIIRAFEKFRRQSAYWA